MTIPRKGEGLKWVGKGLHRVWNNRLAGMEHGFWQKIYNNTIIGYRWNYPEIKGYHSDSNWGVLNTNEDSITMMVSSPGIYLGLFTPQFPPRQGAISRGRSSFLHAIARIDTKFHNPNELGRSGQPNVFDYGGLHHPEGKPGFQYANTIWFYPGEK